MHPTLAHAPPGDEATLWERWRTEADEGARDQLLALHIPFARTVAAMCFGKRFHDEIPFEDYHQSALLGLIEAVDRYDPAQGGHFRGYAMRRMQGAILDALARSSEKQQQIAVRARLLAQRRASLAERAMAGSQAQPATSDAQALELVAQAGVAFALGWLLEGTGMIAPETEPVGQMPFYQGVALRQSRQHILELVQRLPAKERVVIRDHYIQGCPFEQTAVRLGLSRGRISQLHRQALERLREWLQREGPLEITA